MHSRTFLNSKNNVYRVRCSCDPLFAVKLGCLVRQSRGQSLLWANGAKPLRDGELSAGDIVVMRTGNNVWPINDFLRQTFKTEIGKPPVA